MTPIHQSWEELAVFAEGLRNGRIDGYPGLVRVGKMSQNEADRGIAVMTAIAEIWRAAFECRLPDPALVGDVDDTDIQMDLMVALDRVRAGLARTPGCAVTARQAERLAAMIEWHRRHSQGPIWCVRITLEFRRLNAERLAKAA